MSSVWRTSERGVESVAVQADIAVLCRTPLLDISRRFFFSRHPIKPVRCTVSAQIRVCVPTQEIDELCTFLFALGRFYQSRLTQVWLGQSDDWRSRISYWPASCRCNCPLYPFASLLLVFLSHPFRISRKFSSGSQLRSHTLAHAPYALYHYSRRVIST